jgi:DNA-binding NtrC family response regulator
MSDERASVLVVDDEVQVVDLYEAWLDSEYDVLTAAGGNAALATVDEDVDVVLLDRRMPTRSGDEVLSEMRSRGLDMPVAMVTAIDPDFDLVDMDFEAYLTKPVTKTDLVDAVEDLLTVSEEADSREEYALTEKRNVLEEEKSDPNLESSNEFADLTERLKNARKRLEERVEDLERRNEDRT